MRDCGVAEAGCKHHDLTEEKLHKVKDKWNEDRIKQLDFINKRLCQNSEEKASTMLIK